MATSQKGMACTPRDRKCGRFLFIFLDFGQISPPSHFWLAVASQGVGEGGGVFNPPRNTWEHTHSLFMPSLCCALQLDSLLFWLWPSSPICPKVRVVLTMCSNLARLSCGFGINDEIMVVVCEGCLCCSIRITIVQGIANSFGRCLLVHFRFGHCHTLEFQFVMSLLFAGGEKPTFKTTAGWCVAHLKGFTWQECHELTPRERNIDFKDGVAMATAKKVAKLLVTCMQCDLELPQRVPTTPKGKNSEVWDTQLSSKRPLEPSPSPNEPSEKKIATPSDSSFSTPHKAIAPKALFFARPSSKTESKEPPMARELRALLSQLEEWQMARPEAALLEDLEEAKEVDWRSKFLRLAAARGGLKKNYFFVGKARSNDTPLDCGLRSFLNHWGDNFLDSSRVLAAQREPMKIQVAFRFLEVASGGGQQGAEIEHGACHTIAFV